MGRQQLRCRLFFTDMKPVTTYINRAFPLLEYLKKYNREAFRGDLAAGITVGIMLIPQGMAYALIAGLPPEYGLYAALVPLVIYAFMGTSRHLSVGPVALVALLVAAAISPLADTPEEYIAMSILLALMVGVMQLLFGLLRMGFLVNLLSHPVLSGFISAAAIIIGLSQMHHLLGIDSVSGGLHEILFGIATQISSVNILTLVVGVASIILIVLFKKKIPALPGPVAAVAAGIILIYLTGLDNRGVAIVGEITSGIPAFEIPVLEWSVITALLPMALAIALVGYMEAIAVAKAVQHKAKNYKIDANQELVALGAANIGGSFFQAFPTTGSFSRTAINFDSDGHSGMSSIISALTVALSLLFLTPLFYFLPNAVLAAIIMVSVFGLIEYGGFKRLWNLGHYDRYMLLATFFGTLFIGIKEGILIGVALSVIMLLYRSARPNYSIMGRIPGTSIYRSIERYDTEREPENLIFRFDAPLHFANAEYFRDEVFRTIQSYPDASSLILDLNGVNEADSTGVDELFEVVEDLEGQGVSVYLSEVKASVRDLIKKSSDGIREWNFYMTIEDAVHASEMNRKKEENLLYDIHRDTK
ncbi:MAG: solute carrier 26 family protein [Balneolaceae bacterium]|nr:MAG: solute carrier 26 family protein [Balneolaceae bacterium]